MKDFRDLTVWQKAHQLTLDVYRPTASFPPHEGLTLRATELKRMLTALLQKLTADR